MKRRSMTIMIIIKMLMIELVRRESDARVEKKIKLEDMLETEKRWEDGNS